MRDVALRMTNISKSFGGVAVLKDVSFEVGRGEVHALLGANGAGKSVLMKILMGVHQPDGGDYVVDGMPVRFASPAQAQRNRVSMVYQEFGLVQGLSVTENIFMDRLPTRWGAIQWQAARQRPAMAAVPAACLIEARCGGFPFHLARRFIERQKQAKGGFLAFHGALQIAYVA